MEEFGQVKAIGMLSGGLDSRLAVKIIQSQGIDVTVLHFRTGFSTADRARRINRAHTGQDEDVGGRLSAEMGAPAEVIDVSEKYLAMVLNPRYGYGSGMNPCVDCRIFMLRQVKAYMEAHGFHFVFTGEVIGQRPMSQKRDQMRTVERESGLEGLLLRPLSAKLLPPTVPEQKGWVDRERLYAIKGRGRKEQIALAEQLGIKDYPQPAGGCMLTDDSFTRRLRDFLAHHSAEVLTPQRADLLTVGRHLRLSPDLEVVMGRREPENDYLETMGEGYWQFTTVDHPGPLALVEGPLTSEQAARVAGVVAAYSDGKRASRVRVQVTHPGGVGQVVTVRPTPRDVLGGWVI